jgi:hypothetical protein
MSQSRRLAAILAADVAGYSRLMGANEEGTLERLKALRRLSAQYAIPLIQETPATATGARERAGARRYRVGGARRAAPTRSTVTPNARHGDPGLTNHGKPGNVS